MLKPVRFWSLLFLAVFIAAGVFFMDSFRDDHFRKVDSPLYALISQQITQTGDWIHLKWPSGKPFKGEHPPLVFWMTALSFKFFGYSVFTAILFCLLAASLTALSTFLIGSLLFSETVGFLSVMGLLLTRYVPRFSKQLTLEVPLMLFVSLALLFFILALKKQKAYFLLFGVFTGLAVLTKGVVGFFPLAIAGIYFLFQREWKLLFHPYFLGSIVISFVIPFSWLWIQAGMNSKQLLKNLNPYIEFVVNGFKGNRKSGDLMGSRFVFFWRFFATCYLITPVAVVGGWFLVKEKSANRLKESMLLLIWFFFYLIIFTASGWRIGYYLLPAYPAFAILFGFGLARLIPEKKHSITIALFSAFMLGNILSPVLMPHKEPKKFTDLMYEKTYFTGAQEVYLRQKQKYPDLVLASFNQDHDEEKEFQFHFRPLGNIETIRSNALLDEQLQLSRPLLLRMHRQHFAKLPESYHAKLKIIYVFGEHVFVTNQLSEPTIHI